MKKIDWSRLLNCIRFCTCEMPCLNRTLIIINNLIDASRSMRTSLKQQSREDIGKINGRHLARNNCLPSDNLHYNYNQEPKRQSVQI